MVKFSNSPGAGNITLRFSPEEISSGSIEFSKAELLRFIQLLGTAHQMLEDDPQLPLANCDWEPDEAVETPWRLEIAPLTKVATIYFDHPCFGPLSFIISQATAEDMTRDLSFFLDAPPPGGHLN